MAQQLHEALIHVRFDGVSRDIPAAQLAVGREFAGDAEIKRSLAQFLEVPEGKLRDHVIDRHETAI